MESTNLGRCSCSESDRNQGRNLVICLDGTSNQSGKRNPNVIELYSKIVKTDEQLVYYNSGIGTHTPKPFWNSLQYLTQVMEKTVNLVIDCHWNLEKIVVDAYRWLSSNYQENDRIYLLGFARGAYHVRVLAGMIHRVGLIHIGNEQQIPLAYEIYATPQTDDSIERAAYFKKTFSREGVVHFVGLWDPVSSVGIIRGKALPLTDSADHVCCFRHVLPLGERRVNFVPEYVHNGTFVAKPDVTVGRNAPLHIKEVRFPGMHSDIGSTRISADLDLVKTPFLWLSFEAVSNGLMLASHKYCEHWAI